MPRDPKDFVQSLSLPRGRFVGIPEWPARRAPVPEAGSFYSQAQGACASER